MQFSMIECPHIYLHMCLPCCVWLWAGLDARFSPMWELFVVINRVILAIFDGSRFSTPMATQGLVWAQNTALTLAAIRYNPCCVLWFNIFVVRILGAEGEGGLVLFGNQRLAINVRLLLFSRVVCAAVLHPRPCCVDSVLHIVRQLGIRVVVGVRASLRGCDRHCGSHCCGRLV